MLGIDEATRGIDEVVRDVCPGWRSLRELFIQLARDRDTYLGCVPRDIVGLIDPYLFSGLPPLAILRLPRAHPEPRLLFPDALDGELPEYHHEAAICFAILKSSWIARDYEMCVVYDHDTWAAGRLVILATHRSNCIEYRGAGVIFVVHAGREQEWIFAWDSFVIFQRPHPKPTLYEWRAPKFYPLECGWVLVTRSAREPSYSIENYLPYASIRVRRDPAFRLCFAAAP